MHVLRGFVPLCEIRFNSLFVSVASFIKPIPHAFKIVEILRAFNIRGDFHSCSCVLCAFATLQTVNWVFPFGIASNHSGSQKLPLVTARVPPARMAEIYNCQNQSVSLVSPRSSLVSHKDTKTQRFLMHVLRGFVPLCEIRFNSLFVSWHLS